MSEQKYAHFGRQSSTKGHAGRNPEIVAAGKKRQNITRR